MNRIVAYDLETHLIEAGIFPRLVCGSTASGDMVGELLDRVESLHWARKILAFEQTIAGANIAFDFGVLASEDNDRELGLLELIFKAYGEGRVHDVQIAQALDAIATGHLGSDPRTGGPLINPGTGKQTNRYSLATCVDLMLGRIDAKKNDFYHSRYAILENIPQADWPPEARQYPIDDAVNTLEVAAAQLSGHASGLGERQPLRNLDSVAAQAETAFALHLGAMWGLRTDRERVEALRAKTEKEHAAFVERFQKIGFFKADGKEDAGAVRKAVAIAYGASEPCLAQCRGGKVLSPKSGNPINCKACSGTGLNTENAPRTDTGGVSANRDALMESGDPDLMAFGESEAEKVRDTYLPFLESGLDRPITLRPNVLVASFRTSYDGLIQLLPREGGVRECIRARGAWSGSPIDYVFCSVDYAALELCTLAQVCYWLFGRSQMMETINATGDPGSLHTAFAAHLAGKTTEEMITLVKNKDPNAVKYRQAAKAGNFGFPGGMGAAKFVLSKRKKSEGKTVAADGTEYPGIRFCILLADAERCGVEKVTAWKDRPTPPLCKACVELVERELRPAWFKQWPEIKEYFAWVNARVEAGGEFPCWGTESIRGGLDFTSGANHSFQNLAATGAKYALRKVTRECYLDRSSALWGTRPIFFAHDEIVAEQPAKTAHLAGPRMSEVMVSAMKEYVPDVAIVAEPALQRFWYKAAEAVHVDGKLVPWEPKGSK